VRSSNAASVSSRAQFLAACMVCRCLAIFADKFKLARAASALCCCATLPLECGRALMAHQVVSSLGTVQVDATLLIEQASLFCCNPHYCTCRPVMLQAAAGHECGTC
jgi:hypothetical protein